MSCNADIETETVKDVISVPIQSVTARSDFNPKNEEEEEAGAKPEGNGKKENKFKEVVFIVENGKAKMVSVEAGISDKDYLYIKLGLKGGEEVVSGSYRAISRELKDGVTVRIEGKKGPIANNQ
jgi:HlyD family secretion protein